MIGICILATIAVLAITTRPRGKERGGIEGNGGIEGAGLGLEGWGGLTREGTGI